MNIYFRLMTKLLRYCALLLLFISTVNCEKDDICVDGDTPFLIIGFFDAADSTTVKSAVSLRIREIDEANVLNYAANTEVRLQRDRQNADSTAVPLRINAPLSRLLLTINSADEDGVEIGVTDTVDISYTVREKFVSRACGFIANFELDTTQPVPTTNNWILGIEIVEPQVEFSNQIHVKIYH